MAFECLIGEEPYEFIEIPITHNECLVVVEIGRDRDTGDKFFARVALTPYMPGELEYSFSIFRRDPDTGEEEFYDSGLDVSAFMSKPDKELVLKVVLAATAKLLEIMAPTKVYRCTNDVSPPERALEKHHAISHVFKTCGYRVSRSDDWYGKIVWLAER